MFRAGNHCWHEFQPDYFALLAPFHLSKSDCIDFVVVSLRLTVLKWEDWSFLMLFSFFLQVATKTLPFYTNYFSVPYPLPKIDLIAIADFAAG